MNENPGYQTVQMTGVVQEGQIELMPTMRVHYGLQVLGAGVGAVGAALAGAALGPMVVSGTELPAVAMQALANLCTADKANCSQLSLGGTKSMLWLLIVGLVLMGGQVFVLFKTSPRSVPPKS